MSKINYAKCGRIGCPENYSVCCDALPKDTGEYKICRECKRPFMPNLCLKVSIYRKLRCFVFGHKGKFKEHIEDKPRNKFEYFKTCDYCLGEIRFEK